MLGRIISAGLSDGRLGLDAVREGLEQQGVMEVTRMRERIGYIGLIASVAPMLGLLGTVTGMIASFRLLGEAQGAARPDELALGISQALVTTCMGLVRCGAFDVLLRLFSATGSHAWAMKPPRQARRCSELMSVVLETRKMEQQK